MLGALLHRHPALGEEAETIARTMMVDVDPDAVADEVEWDLRAVSVDALNSRAGRQRGGYVHPADAAWEILGETVAPIRREVDRLLALGLSDPAVETALGIISGLHRCDGCDDRDLLLSWAPDFPGEEAGKVVKQLTDAGCGISSESLAAVAPEWGYWLAAEDPWLKVNDGRWLTLPCPFTLRVSSGRWTPRGVSTTRALDSSSLFSRSPQLAMGGACVVPWLTHRCSVSGARSAPFGQTTVPLSSSTRTCRKKVGSRRGSKTSPHSSDSRLTSPASPSWKVKWRRCSPTTLTALT